MITLTGTSYEETSQLVTSTPEDRKGVKLNTNQQKSTSNCVCLSCTGLQVFTRPAQNIPAKEQIHTQNHLRWKRPSKIIKSSVDLTLPNPPLNFVSSLKGRRKNSSAQGIEETVKGRQVTSLGQKKTLVKPPKPHGQETPLLSLAFLSNAFSWCFHFLFQEEQKHHITQYNQGTPEIHLSSMLV